MHALARDDRLETRYLAAHVAQFVFELEYFEMRETRETHVEHGLSLDLGKLETLAQRFLSRRGALARFDYFDNFVDVAHGDHKPFQNMLALFRRVKLVLGSAQYHLALIVYVVRYYIEQAHELRLAVRDSNHIEREVRGKIGVLEQRVYYLARVIIAFYLDHRARAASVGFVHNVGNSAQHAFFIFAHFYNIFEQLRFVHLVRQFVNDYYLFVAVVFYVHFRADGDFALARLVRLFKLGRDNNAARREIRTFDNLHHVLERNARIVYKRYNAVDSFH